MTQVIIDDVIPRTQLIATASQTVFNTNWTADASSDILVYARAEGVDPDDATQLVSSSLYNVTFIGVSATVRVTFLSGRTLNDVITIVRNTPSERLNLYINTNFTPSMLNQDFGILTLVDQQAQMYDTVVNPGYNVSATIANKDKILPILGANQIWAMNNSNDEIIVYNVPSGGGIAPDDATYIVKTADSELPNAQVMGALASGLVVNTITTGVQLTRILTGTTNQITISNGSGISGNPTVSISANPILSGTSGLGIPQGTTAQRVIPVSGISLRYNTDLQDVEYWDGAQWVQFADPVGEELTSTDDTNVTLVLGGSPLTALVNAASLTLGWTGQLSPARGGTGINNGTSTLTLAGNLATSGAFASTFTMTGATNVTFPTSGTLATTAGSVSSVSGTLNRITSTGGTTPVIDISASYVGQTSITTLGTIGTGIWQGTVIGGTYGGTGVNNGASTLTLGGSLATVGAFASSFTMTGITNVTFPTSGTLLTSAGAVTSLTATANQTTVSASTGAITTGIASNPILPGTGGVTLPQGNTAARAGGAGTIRFNTQSLVFESTIDGAAWATIDTSASGDVDSIIGTANQIIASNPTGNVTLSLPQSIATSSAVTFASVAFSSTSGIIGTTTNDDAAAGSVGQEVESIIPFASAISLTTNTPANVTSISLTAGDWDVWGNVGFNGNAATTFSTGEGWVSSTSATVPDLSLFSNRPYGTPTTIFTTDNVCFTVPQRRFKLSGTTTIYLGVFAVFAVNTCSAYGAIYARRRR